MTSAAEEYDKLVWPMMMASRVCACWPTRAEIVERSPLYQLHRLVTIILIALIVIGNTSEIVVFFGEDMNETIECALVSSAFYMAFTRTLVFASHKSEMLYVVETMRDDWAKSSPEERDVLRDKCLLAFKLGKFFILSVIFAGSAFVFMPMLEVAYINHVSLFITKGVKMSFTPEVQTLFFYQWCAKLT